MDENVSIDYNRFICSINRLVFIIIFLFCQFDKIDSLNIEINVFLRHLRTYADKKKYRINDKTIELLMNTIDKFIANAEIDNDSDQQNIDFLSNLNENNYEIRQYIMCRLCSVSRM